MILLRTLDCDAAVNAAGNMFASLLETGDDDYGNAASHAGLAAALALGFVPSDPDTLLPEPDDAEKLAAATAATASIASGALCVASATSETTEPEPSTALPSSFTIDPTHILILCDSITRVMRQVHPDIMIGDAAIADCRSRLMYLGTAMGDALRGPTDAVVCRHLEDVCRTVLNGELGAHAISEGTKAATKFDSARTRDADELCIRAGLQFPVRRRSLSLVIMLILMYRSTNFLEE